MKKILPLSLILAAVAVLLPAVTSARVVKQGLATSRVTSQGATANSIYLSSSSQSRQLFEAITSSAGLTDTLAQIDGDQPSSLTSTGLGNGKAAAFGKNKGQTGGLMLPEVKGISNSAVSVGSQSFASIQ